MHPHLRDSLLGFNVETRSLMKTQTTLLNMLFGMIENIEILKSNTRSAKIKEVIEKITEAASQLNANRKYMHDALRESCKQTE